MTRCTSCTTGVKTSDGSCTNGCPPAPYTRADGSYVNLVGALYTNDEGETAFVSYFNADYIVLSAAYDGALVAELTLEQWEEQLHGCYWSYIGMGL